MRATRRTNPSIRTWLLIAIVVVIELANACGVFAGASRQRRLMLLRVVRST